MMTPIHKSIPATILRLGMGLISTFFLTACSQRCGGIKYSSEHSVELKDQTISIGCSMCIFKMPGSKECELAAEVEGQPYLVQGSGIDDHGDAHAADGLCNTTRQARATGRIQGEVLVVSELRVVPQE